jgi:gluconate kinase
MITDRDRGYWEALCDACFLGADNHWLRQMIECSSLKHKECEHLMWENPYQADKLKPVVKDVFLPNF